MKVRIIVDSTADLTPEVKKKLTVVPLTVSFGTAEYVDGVTITHEEFYEMLVEGDVMPTTSQPTPDAFEKIYHEVTEAGETAVVLTVSSKLSGTYQSARIAREGYSNIFVVDSRTVAIGLGVLAQLALKLADEGLTAEQIAKKLEAERDKVCLVAMLNTLEFLKRGGRISKTAAFAGELLSIKPVISVQDGQIGILGKARGSKQGNNLLIQQIQGAGGVDFDKPVLLGYTGMNDTLLQKYIRDSSFLWENHVAQLPFTIIGSVVGTHAGPGAVAVAFFKKD